MRHYEIGTLELKDNKWYLSFFNQKLIKIFLNFHKASNFANIELKKFIDFAGEGAVYRIIENGKIIFHQNDIEEDGYEEYQVTFDEYFYTHFFYATDDDKKMLGKVNGHVIRTHQQEKWYQEEVENSNHIRKFSQEKINKITQKITNEMSNQVNEYIVKNNW